MPGFLGQGLREPYKVDGDLYVPIPKNASSAHRQIFTDAGWQKFDFQVSYFPYNSYAVTRDPIDRWFSGVNQYCASNRQHKFEDVVREVANGDRYPVVDENTMHQVAFLLPTIRHRLFTVQLEVAWKVVEERWGLVLPQVNVRRHQYKEFRQPAFIRKLENFYRDDFELHNEAYKGVF